MTTPLLVLPESSARWYDRAGTPVLEVPYADPKRGMRAADLRDARKLHLLPSVTNVISTMSRPGLEAWKATQYVLAALTLHQKDGESTDDFAARVIEDANTERDQAADAGARLHELIERYFLGLPTLGVDEYKPHLDAFAHWWVSTSWDACWPEHQFADTSNGFGGKVDLIAADEGEVLIIDWKSQATRPDKPIAFYDEWAIQLGGYALGTGRTDARLINVVVSRTEPGRIQYKDWTEKDGERERWIAAFHAALCLWKFRHAFYPGEEDEE